MSRDVVVSGSSGLIWIHSDLQLSNPERAKECLSTAVADILALELPVAAIWCLGDATSGADIAALQIVVADTRRLLDRLAVPVCYVLGNHDLDPRRLGMTEYPLFDAAQAWSHWHTAATVSDLYFERSFFGCRVFFLGDHVATDGSWFVSHGAIKEHPELYPHTPAVYEQLRQRMAASTVPVLTAGHCAFPGGQRPGPLLEQLLPLPSNVVAHFFGHAHIGDLVHNKANPWLRRNPINGPTTAWQYNVSALESQRSPGSHSAFLEFAASRPVGLRIRCHQQRQWEEYFPLG